ncbi:MAG: YggS family pyridoxal phosphate-dependent enzyme [Ruminiclostridium sp.]|jgi:pyridoxal phosphate enzyme (YggS family)|nr:YggS family pyridoxal phosphate-dependent enzyme [Ruminiclostridium sp.]
MPETKSYEVIAENVAAVKENMRQAALAAGRNPEEITLVAATKVQTSETIRNAIKAGITVCGENRVQELVAHLEDNAYEGAKVHFIGHLQTNKVKFVVGKVDMIESIDSVRLMDAVEKQAAKVDVVQDILLEVNIGDEESKGGAAIDEVMALATHAMECPHLRLRGIMCIPPAASTDEENRGFFKETYQLFVDMKEKLGDNNPNIDCISMGMSGDYPLAIEGGSTMVRVGTALFGARPPWKPQG